MACADIPMAILKSEEPQAGEEQKETIIKYFQASKPVPQAKGPIDALLKKQPAMCGSMQIVSGAFSVAVGVAFAISLNMADSLFTLFRVSHLTGLLYFIAGLLSNLLFRYPRLVPVCFFLNCGCIIVSVVGGALICVDLANVKKEHWKVELFELCVLILEVFLSLILCCFFCKYK